MSKLDIIYDQVPGRRFNTEPSFSSNNSSRHNVNGSLLREHVLKDIQTRAKALSLANLNIPTHNDEAIVIASVMITEIEKARGGTGIFKRAKAGKKRKKPKKCSIM